MIRRESSKQKRGTTLVEILVAVALLLIIFLFITGDLIQSSWAENMSATRTETMSAANYLLGVMRNDSKFWSGPSGNDWARGPELGTSTDPCGNSYPPYTDSITTPTWHSAPACAASGTNPGLFADLVGVPSFQYMWNAQQQGADPTIAQLTVWVQIDEGGRLNVYELHSTRGNIQTPAPGSGKLQSPPGVGSTSSPCSGSCSSPSSPPRGSPTPNPTTKPSPTPTPSHTPAPSPVPSGTFE